MPIYQGENRIDRIQLGPLILGSPIEQVYLGEDLVHQRYREQWSEHTTSTTVAAPSWASFLDVAVCGGGGGGSGGARGAAAQHGRGGGAGSWSQERIPVQPGQQVTVAIGNGGAGGSSGGTGGGGNGSAGGATVVSAPGVRVSAPGGSGGSGNTSGSNNSGTSASSFTAFGKTFPGGSGGGRDQAGSAPGGGGGGGEGAGLVFPTPQSGARGGSGIAHLGFTTH